MKSGSRAFALALALSIGPISADADLAAVTLAPISHAQATLTVVAEDGSSTSYTPADLETLPTYRMETTTPWRDTPSAFEGVLLADLLRAHGLDQTSAIRIVAENDFASKMEREVWETLPILIATRVDGQPHNRRERGPIQFIIDADDYASSDVASESHLVWMASRIEPLD